MRKVLSGGVEIDRCLSCGALWLDAGEIRELTEGRLGAEPGEGCASVPPHEKERPVPGGEEKERPLSSLHEEARGMRCPRCGGGMGAVDFQATGIPLLRCRGCGGYLAPRRQAAAVAARFREYREQAPRYAALGEQIAREEKRRMTMRHGPGGDAPAPGIPLPFLMPLADGGDPPSRTPWVTWGLAALTAAVALLARIADLPVALPGGLRGLPPGDGFSAVTPGSLLLVPFLPGGLLPLAASILFLLVLGDNVEERLGRVPFLAFYLLCGAVAGASHLLWGPAGDPPARGAAGAVAGILGAYLVFFPQVSIEMYGMGRLLSAPAYVFACLWAAGVFLFSPGPIANLVDPTPLSLPGHVAGFLAGAGTAILWRTLEESAAQRSV